MTDSPEVFALAVLATIFAGISKGGFGSGAAFASSALMALVLPPMQALGLMLPLLMLIDVVSLPHYWRRWSWPESKVLLFGSIPGVALGVALFSMANDDVLRLLIGGVALGFVLWQLWPRKQARAKLPNWVGLIAGATAGFTSFVSHAGGPPVAVFLLTRGIDKTTYQATTVLIFWVINIAKAIPYAFLGVFSLEVLIADLWLAPFAILGTWIGVKAHYLVSERVFFGLTYLLLTVTGSKLFWDALT
ncbi:sulfite exporter TauE/SafE family protein [Shimia thalassica]|uniref:sulfite exporter TauE/SafE family protein n=1 Tax=Shimia thalassica TaxID=1715693 RepID=UPI0026E3F8E8|nr:sulfite exporter TauE/SafE family protein [Shimia thalassica]MDO6521601.1 sulfite exporter TauE/SafE family protein [Shimia thalassica]